MGQINLGRVMPNYIGEWNSTREYSNLDVVSYSGSSYLCKRTNKNSAPTETNTNWILLAKKGDTGDKGETGSTAADFISDFVNGGVINVTDTTSIDIVYEGLKVGGIALCIIGDASGSYPSTTTRVNFNNKYFSSTNYFFSTDKRGANVGDILMITKQNYLLINRCALRVIPINDAKVPSGSDYGTDGCMTYQDKIKLSSLSLFNHNTSITNMNDALYSGIYPWCTLGRPSGSVGAYTCIVNRSADTDYNGFYTVAQTAFGREGEDIGEVWQRLIFIKADGTRDTLEWIKLSDEEFTIPDRSITQEKLAFNSVGVNQIENGAIDWLKIADGAISDVHLSNGIVTSEKIADGAITTNKIANGSITNDKIDRVSYTKVSTKDFTEPTVEGEVSVELTDFSNQNKASIRKQVFSIIIPNDATNAPWEYALRDLVNIQERDFILSINGSYKGYDTQGNLVAVGCYPHSYMLTDYGDGYYFNPVPDKLNSSVDKLECAVSVEWIIKS